MHIATISSQRQITIPKALLDQLSLSAKDKVKIEVDNDQLMIKKTVSLMDLSGCLRKYIHPSKLGVSFEHAKKVAIANMLKQKLDENNLPY